MNFNLTGQLPKMATFLFPKGDLSVQVGMPTLNWVGQITTLIAEVKMLK